MRLICEKRPLQAAHRQVAAPAQDPGLLHVQIAACRLCKTAPNSDPCLQGAEEDEICRDGTDH